MLLQLLMTAVVVAATPPDSAHRWTLKTVDTEIELGLESGIPAVTGLHVPGTSWNWIREPNREALPESVVTDGVVHKLSWRLTDARFEAEEKRVVFNFVNDSPALQLTSVWQAVRNRGPIEHWLTLRNAAATRVTIGSQTSLRLEALAAPLDHYIESTQVRRGGSNAQTQGGILTQTVGSGWDTTVNSRPSDGANAVTGPDADAASQIPFLSLQVDATHGLYVGWKFSGSGRITGRVVHGDRLDLAAGLPEDFATELLPAESFLIPAAFIGTYSGDPVAGSYSVHRYVMESLLPRGDGGPYPTLAYNYYLDGGEPGTQKEADVLASARLAHELGFETFVADAMWFPDSGDWRWDPKRFPRGSQPIADYLHRNGMKFGLWMAWTHASRFDQPGAMSFKKHPDWFTAPPKFPSEGNINWDAQIDVGNEAARAWVEDETARAVREYQLDYFKTDHSPIALNSTAQRGRGGHETDVSYWSALGYYAIQEALLRKFPRLVLESCSGGGRIKDFGNIAHAHYVVGTDTLSALADRQSVYDTSVMFPPATIQLYTYERLFSPVADAPEPYLWRSGMMGAWQIDLTESAKLTDRQKQEIKRSTEIYRNWIRPVLADAKIHRILPRPDGTHWDGLFYWNDAIGRGTVYVFRPNSEQSRQVVRLAGLKSDGRYHIHGEDRALREKTTSGRALMDEGVSVTLPSRFASEIIYVESNHGGDRKLP